MSDQISGREFRLDSQYIRCGFYFLVGCIMLGLAALWGNQFVPGRTAGQHAFPWMIFLIAPLGLLPLRWRLQVDEQGVWRRRILGWDLWSWEDFSSGRLRFGHLDRSLVDPARPRWRRLLALGNMRPTDSDQVWGWICTQWLPPESPPLPDRVEIRFGTFMRKRLILEARGIEVGWKSRLERFSWQQVVGLEITRLRHERDDFLDLVLIVPNQKMKFVRRHQNGFENRNWKGPKAEIMARILTTFVSKDRQLIVASKGAARTEKEREYRLVKWEKLMRDARRWGWGGGLLLLVLGVWAIMDQDWIVFSIFAFQVLPVASFLCMQYNQMRKNAAELRRERGLPFGESDLSSASGK